MNRSNRAQATSELRLPFRVSTQFGRSAVFSFRLHPESQAPVKVEQILSAVLSQIDDACRLSSTANGDVLQALSMALAVRTAMLDSSPAAGRRLATDLVRPALTDAEQAAWSEPRVGYA